MTDTPINIVAFFGHNEIDTRFRSEGRDLVGEGRTRRFDADGRLVEDTGWQPTGVRLVAPPEIPHPWWKFWG